MPKNLSEVRRAIPVGDRDAQANATVPITDHVDLTDYRPITPQEKALLTAMLHSTTPPATAFLPQLEGMLVTSSCTCGCPSIAFAPPPEDMRIQFRTNMVAEMFGYSSNGRTDTADIYVHLMLHQAGGKLTGLEVYDLAGNLEDHLYPLPAVETLRTSEQERANLQSAPQSSARATH